jgi:hypothetical protein
MIDYDQCVIDIDNRYFKPVIRWFYGDSRNYELIFVKYLIKRTINYCKDIIIKHKAENISTDYDLRTLQILLGELQSAKNGLTNLKSTYIKDQRFQSSIDEITSAIDMNSTDCSNYFNKFLK